MTFLRIICNARKSAGIGNKLEFVKYSQIFLFTDLSNTKLGKREECGGILCVTDGLPCCNLFCAANEVLPPVGSVI